MHHFNHTHLSVQQTRCGCLDAPVAFLPASHLDSPRVETFDEIMYQMNQRGCCHSDSWTILPIDKYIGL